MEQIIFPVPGICEFLTKETKYRLFTTTEQDEQGSKVSDFFDQSSFLHNEMEWQKKLRSKSEAEPPLGCPGGTLGDIPAGKGLCTPGSGMTELPLPCRAPHTWQSEGGIPLCSQGSFSTL